MDERQQSPSLVRDVTGTCKRPSVRDLVGLPCDFQQPSLGASPRFRGCGFWVKLSQRKVRACDSWGLQPQRRGGCCPCDSNDRLLHECFLAGIWPCRPLQMPPCLNLHSDSHLSSPGEVHSGDKAERTVFLGLSFHAVKGANQKWL